MFPGSTQKYLVEHTKLKKQNKNEEAALEYRAKNIQRTVRDNKGVPPDFIGDGDVKYYISTGVDSDEWYKKNESKRMDTKTVGDLGMQMLFFQINKKSRESGKIPEPEEYIKIKGEKVSVICKVDSVFIGPKRATGYMTVDAVSFLN